MSLLVLALVLALVLVVGLAGPLLATPKSARIPVVVGEILLGVLVGRTGLGWVRADTPELSFLATIGFGLVMLEAGSHVPLGDPALRGALRRGVLRGHGQRDHYRRCRQLGGVNGWSAGQLTAPPHQHEPQTAARLPVAP